MPWSWDRAASTGPFPEILDQRDGEATAAGIVLHELAHLVGLDHVDDGSQLLYPETVRGVTDFADGDLTGLAHLGRRACVPELRRPLSGAAGTGRRTGR